MGRGVPHPRSRQGVPHPRSGLGEWVLHPADGGGYSIPDLDWGVPHPADGGYPIPGLNRGYSIPGPDRRYPILLVGGYPIQSWMGGTPPQVWMGEGYPMSGLDGGYPILLVKTWWGYPLSKTGWSTPTIQDWMGYPPAHQEISIVSTCYAAGGVPLSFTQQSFLLHFINTCGGLRSGMWSGGFCGRHSLEMLIWGCLVKQSLTLKLKLTNLESHHKHDLSGCVAYFWTSWSYQSFNFCNTSA